MTNVYISDNNMVVMKILENFIEKMLIGRNRTQLSVNIIIVVVSNYKTICYYICAILNYLKKLTIKKKHRL